MIFSLIVIFLSFIALLVIHEFGHFILAKKFGVEVEEFGIFYPPRLFGKKISRTIYSINLIPFGAFVRLKGEDDSGEKNPGAFASKPVWQRMLIVLGGVITFWLAAIVLFAAAGILGAPSAISDQEQVSDAKVQIAALAKSAPAEEAGLRPGDAVIRMVSGIDQIDPSKVSETQEFISSHKGQELEITIQRGKEILVFNTVPRENPPAGEGALGVALVRTAVKKYPFFTSVWFGIKATVELTVAVVAGWYSALRNLIVGAPTGVQLVGPVGIFDLMSQAFQVGAVYFIEFIAMISVYVAVFNILPIPVVDGGRFLFLAIEGIRKRPVSREVEAKISAFFFFLLIGLMIFVTFKDIMRLI